MLQQTTNKPTGLSDFLPRTMAPRFFNWMVDNYEKIVWILYGGSGGGKSYSVVDHLVYVCANVPNLVVMVTRKTRPSLKATTWQMFNETMERFGLVSGRDFERNLTDLEIRFKNGTWVRFTSIDDPQKIKSSSVNVVYVEEVTEFSEEDYFFIQNTIRRPVAEGYPNRLIVTFNPVDINHWVWQRIVLRRDMATSGILHSTYKDNPFLPAEYRRRLEDEINFDANKYRVYTLGEPGVLENAIYTNYEVGQMYAHHYTEGGALGVDFGFNNPAAVVEVYVRAEKMYVKEHVYESHLTNSELIEKIKALGRLAKLPIYCDSAEPDRIFEFVNAGLDAQPADKNVKLGIDFIKRQRVILDSSSTHLIEEIRSYQYRKDRNGQILEEPSKVRDHACDAFRYAAYTHYGKNQQEFEMPQSLIGFGGVSTGNSEQIIQGGNIVYTVDFGFEE